MTAIRNSMPLVWIRGWQGQWQQVGRFSSFSDKNKSDMGGKQIEGVGESSFKCL